MNPRKGQKAHTERTDDMAKAATKKAAGKKAPAKGKQEKIPGSEPQKPADMPLKMRAEQLASDSKEYLALLADRAKVEDQQGKLREKKKKVQARLDELAYQLAYAIKDPQLRLDEVAAQAAEDAVTASNGQKGQK